MGVYKKLAQIQYELNVPKSREIFLKKGKVSYRKYEDIMKALKPLLNKYQACLLMSDEIEAVTPDRVYIKTTLKFIDLETEDCIESTALAREESNTQEGAVAKTTLSVSCYARKSALVALFCIDDSIGDEQCSSNTNKNNKRSSSFDESGNEITNDEELKQEIATLSREELLQVIYKQMKEKNITRKEVCERYKTDSLEKLCDKSLGKVCIALYKSKQKK